MWWNYSARRLVSERINDYGKDETGCDNQVVEGAALDVMIMCDETFQRAAWSAWESTIVVKVECDVVIKLSSADNTWCLLKRAIMVQTDVRESSLQTNDIIDGAMF